MNKTNKEMFETIVNYLIGDYNESKESFGNTCKAKIDSIYHDRAELLAIQAMDGGYNFSKTRYFPVRANVDGGHTFSTAQHFPVQANTNAILSGVFLALYDRYYGIRKK